MGKRALKKAGKGLSKLAAIANPAAILGTDTALKSVGVGNAPITSDASAAVTGAGQKVFDKATGAALAGLAPDIPPIEVPSIEAPLAADEDEDEDTAQQTVRRRISSRARSNTLLESGLGGGRATVGRPTLLGGG